MRRKQYNQARPTTDYPQEKKKLAKQCQECDIIKKYIRENMLNKIYELMQC